jgi:hypothetical protein
MSHGCGVGQGCIVSNGWGRKFGVGLGRRFGLYCGCSIANCGRRVGSAACLSNFLDSFSLRSNCVSASRGIFISTKGGRVLPLDT